MNSEENFSNLVLVRHGQSEWNAKNLFTGWKNPGLTDKGLEDKRSEVKYAVSELIILSGFAAACQVLVKRI